MDKKNLTIGILLVIAAIASMLFGPKAPQPTTDPAAVREAVSQQEPAEAAPPPGTPPTLAPAGPQAAFASANADSDTSGPELANSFMSVRFTANGGAIRDVAFVARESGRLKYPAIQNLDRPFIFNELHVDPLLAIVGLPGLDRNARFELVSATDTEVVYRARLGETWEVTRRYTLPPDEGESTDPYQIQHSTTLRNLTDSPTAGMTLSIALGTAAPVNADDNGLLLTTGYFDGDDASFTRRSSLQSSNGFLGIGQRTARRSIENSGPIDWAVVSNQFFASILTPAEPADGLVTERVWLLTELSDDTPNAYGLSATARFNLPGVAPGEATGIEAGLYVGPKEYRRLANTGVFERDQDKIMQYSRFFLFRWCSQILTTMMSAIHSTLPETNWGWGYAIILTTLVLKLFFLPLTFSAQRSMKRMQKLQPEMLALREKYKDNPQKMQQGMMELYKQHKVNPLGGCIPMLIPMPFFIGFFSMLRSTAELRFAPFLWASDLSAPDTIYRFFDSVPLNILPLLMGATMVFQMRMVPQAPTADNMQVKMMKFMPYMFTFFCYNFSCALALYSTTNGLFTIGQQLLINRMKDDGDPANRPANPGNRPLKNVTPKKGKKLKS